MAESVSHHRNLKVWARALDWAEQMHRTTADWPRDERFGLITQIRRSSVSIASNIAEGAARRTTGEFIHFIGIAQGSLAEAETQLLLAIRLGDLPEEHSKPLLESSDEISRMLAALAVSLARRRTSSH